MNIFSSLFFNSHLIFCTGLCLYLDISKIVNILCTFSLIVLYPYHKFIYNNMYTYWDRVSYFFYTVQREVTLNVNMTFWRENADGRLCSPMAWPSVTLIIGLGWCLEIAMPFAVAHDCLNNSPHRCTCVRYGIHDSRLLDHVMVLIAIWPVQKSENAMHLTGHKDSGTTQILREKWRPAGTSF